MGTNPFLAVHTFASLLAIQGHMTSQVSMVIKDHELLSNLKFGRFMLRRLEDKNFFAFCYIDYGQPCLNVAEHPTACSCMIRQT